MCLLQDKAYSPQNEAKKGCIDNKRNILGIFNKTYMEYVHQHVQSSYLAAICSG